MENQQPTLTTTAPNTTPPEPEPGEVAKRIEQLRDEQGIACMTLPPKLADVLSKFNRETPEAAERRRQYERDEAERERIQEHARRQENLADLMRAVGNRYHSATLDTFQAELPEQIAVLNAARRFMGRMEESVKHGLGAVFFGPPGTGKDHLLVAFMREAIVRHGFKVLWQNGLDLYGEIRDRIGDDRDERSLIHRLTSPDVLAISDPLPPWGPLTPFQATTLLRVVDGRYRNQRPTWITVNTSGGKEATERMGDAIVDRLKERAAVFSCNWPSWRAKTEPGAPA